MTRPQIALHWKSNTLLPVGTLIQPGNWGRTILGIGSAHNQFFQELLFEEIRKNEFAHQLSRMEAAFAFADRRAAESWKRSQIPEVIYSVVPDDPQASLVELDMQWWNIAKQCHSFDGAKDIARKYWSAARSPQSISEVLVSCPLKITSQ